MDKGLPQPQVPRIYLFKSLNLCSYLLSLYSGQTHLKKSSPFWFLSLMVSSSLVFIPKHHQKPKAESLTDLSPRQCLGVFPSPIASNRLKAQLTFFAATSQFKHIIFLLHLQGANGHYPFICPYVLHWAYMSSLTGDNFPYTAISTYLDTANSRMAVNWIF
ncbi:hypothetical protein Echvi_4013 [Echinicola vietnamensis DSM 17526]|uniref:Uncharacterized protein n=1 Tax=Echinicola vietnamensis (strain DSM 17526 / LMG 23754 / KMM 6221) TaxID=926556 RepID=L0G5V1_ECHVK|nr:hypothetical protein Echvi_4013 [Echinicola vietnamensis DSM 17526]